MGKFIYTDPTPGICDNCGASLHGEYCHLCGQQDKTYIRNIFSLIHEFLQEFGNWDSRLARTLVPLVFKPGFLSSEYVSGRRARYVPPLRLYLFISLMFFLIVAMVAKVDTTEFRKQVAQVTPPAESIEELPTSVPQRSGPGITFNSHPRYRHLPLEERVYVNLSWLTEETNAELHRRVVRSIATPELALQQLRQLAPPMMFLLLPFFAVLLKLLYLFAGRYYTEHFTLALHTHAFLFTSFLLLMAFSAIQGWSVQYAATGWIGTVMTWLAIALWVWIPLYLLLAQKYFYRQGWFLTLIKYFMTSIVYFFMVAVGATGLFLISVITA